MKYSKGFTLIELVAVIALLGILSAVAIPRFIHLGSSARAAVIENLGSSIETAASLIRSQAIIEGVETEFQTTMEIDDGYEVSLHFGYPIILDEEYFLHSIVRTNICFIDRNSGCTGQGNVFEIRFVPSSQVYGDVSIHDTEAKDPDNCHLYIKNATYQITAEGSYILDQPLSVTPVTSGC